ncbi:AAA family ATPase [Nonomuraea sp. NPDC050153]|uniref:AAA family ATPase n=1 Tax=Nonomuraea sp. NPDC050153 TaxID=3364359 RepID=UPI0037B697DE
MSDAEPFAGGREHLAAELAWLDQALLVLVAATRPAVMPDGAEGGAEGGHGWFVTAPEAEWLLSGGADPGPVEPPPALKQARTEISARVAATRHLGRSLVLPALRDLFELTPEEELLLVACAAAELDARYGKVYGYLHDDTTKRRPSLRLVTALAALDPRCPADGGALLDPSAAVFRWRMVDEAGTAAHHPIRGLSLDPAVLALITGSRAADRRIECALRPLPEPAPEAEAEAWPYDDMADRLTTLLGGGRRHLAAHFHGSRAAEGRRIAAAACRRLGTRMLHADAGELLSLSQSGALPLAEGLRLVYRQAALASAGVYLSGIDALLDDPRADAHLRTLERLLADASWFTCTEGERLWLPGPSFPAHVTFLPFDPPRLDHRLRRAAWERALPGLAPDQIGLLAARFPSTPAEIDDTLRLARGRAEADGEPEPGAGKGGPRYEDLVWACSASRRAALDGLARPVTPCAGWDDLVLPPDLLAQLRELCAQVRHRGRVLDEWALGRRASLGRGVQALFLGPSGTGKTLAAEVVAGAVGMDLMKVDLSTVVSKYIGETEKHLGRLFDGAERSGSILFFDEADALFGKRSEVGDAHDRYANIEVSYLLQRVEEYAGVVVLATNFAQNIDEAFQRRIRVSVAFPFPDEAARLAIWRRHLPEELPVAADLDLPGMARRFKVSGGVIRKIVWNAAFLAADDGGRVGNEHLLLATRREYERMGKPFLAAEAVR